jgi:enterochelin esterase-like enzyme
MPPILRLVLAIILFAAAAPGHAGSPAAEGRIVEMRVESEALGRGLDALVYLPAAARSAERMPVVYLLHGYGGGRFQWLRDGRIAATLDGLIAAGRLPAMIAVMPDAGNSWYLDSGAHGGPGDYETALVRDLVAAVDAAFPTVPRREARAVAGLSMGGFGALRLGFRHPEVFGAVAAMSPAIWKPGALSWPRGPAGMEPAAAAAKFVGNAESGFDLAAFAAQVPFADVASVAASEAPPAILLTAGDGDSLGHQVGAVEMYLDLRAAGLQPALRVTGGGHDWQHWRAMTGEVLGFLAAGWPPEG